MTLKARPILFQPEMARANWEDRKTNTRRILNKLLRFGAITEFGLSDTPGYDWHFRDRGMRWHELTHAELLECCPYGVVGDLLWVREAWALKDCGRRVSLAKEAWLDGWPIDRLQYQGTDKPPDYHYPSGKPYWWNGRASIHMPRWASRMTLDLTDVRVERVQDISEEDAVAEGCQAVGAGLCTEDPDDYMGCLSARTAYAALWDSINGPGSWGENPWCWSLHFHVHKQNVDALTPPPAGR